MRLKSVSLSGFKRFHSLKIVDLPVTSKLVVVVGPNGSGKSSLFESFNFWQSFTGFNRLGSGDSEYYSKKGPDFKTINEIQQNIQLTFHSQVPNDVRAKKRVFYFRSAYRNEADFQISSISRLGFEEDRKRVGRLIDNDFGVGDNYQAIAGATIGGLFAGQYDEVLGKEIVNDIIGDVRRAMVSIFPDLELNGLGDPLSDGTFLFTKGTSPSFLYKNLSGGEKAAFDLILDFVIKSRVYRDTIFCIDEPETHINSRLQGALLAELVRLVPDGCQIWISTHSIGMMREASQLQRLDQYAVSFINFFDRNFDDEVVLSPVRIDRDLWKNILDVAIGDLAALIAPERIVLCEGKPSSVKLKERAEFDARCFRTIFADDYPDCAFVSVGNEHEVQKDTVELGSTIEALISGTTVLRVVDRDDRCTQEITDLESQGVRVLSRRHLEAYLLDDEVLTALCESAGKQDQTSAVLQIKQSSLAATQAQGKPSDDVKSASGDITAKAKRLLNLSGQGNTADTFMRDTLAPLINSQMNTYLALRKDIFNE